ncbi:MAG: hypothetical protein ACFB50_02060 [Rubrobacteraceae bacterium]
MKRIRPKKSVAVLFAAALVSLSGATSCGAVQDEVEQQVEEEVQQGKTQVEQRIEEEKTRMEEQVQEALKTQGE